MASELGSFGRHSLEVMGRIPGRQRPLCLVFGDGNIYEFVVPHGWHFPIWVPSHEDEVLDLNTIYDVMSLHLCVESMFAPAEGL